MNKKPIGVFDSGVGGLTVLKEITKVLPKENLIYLGDTARVPYGTRGKELIKTFSLQLVDFLLKQDVKFLVIACNTISSTAINEIQKASPVEVIGVIKPSASEIARTTKNKNVGIIGTTATIKSKAYEEEILKIDSFIKIKSKATPLFVSLAEQGFGESKIAKLAAEYYLSDFNEIDTLHLGCTHFPLLRNAIQQAVGRFVKIVDSATPTAEELKKLLIKQNLLNKEKSSEIKFYFTDLTEGTTAIANEFMGMDIRGNAQMIRLF